MEGYTVNFVVSDSLSMVSRTQLLLQKRSFVCAMSRRSRAALFDRHEMTNGFPVEVGAERIWEARSSNSTVREQVVSEGIIILQCRLWSTLQRRDREMISLVCSSTISRTS